MPYNLQGQWTPPYAGFSTNRPFPGNLNPLWGRAWGNRQYYTGEPFNYGAPTSDAFRRLLGDLGYGGHWQGLPDWQRGMSAWDWTQSMLPAFWGQGQYANRPWAQAGSPFYNVAHQYWTGPQTPTRGFGPISTQPSGVKRQPGYEIPNVTPITIANRPQPEPPPPPPPIQPGISSIGPGNNNIVSPGPPRIPWPPQEPPPGLPGKPPYAPGGPLGKMNVPGYGTQQGINQVGRYRRGGWF